jgi:hypothetical protein
MWRIDNPETKTHNQSRIDKFEVDCQAFSQSQQMQHEAHYTYYNPNRNPKSRTKWWNMKLRPTNIDLKEVEDHSFLTQRDFLH